MFRLDLGTTINYQLYVSSRPWHNNQPYILSKTWHNNQLSIVCFVQDLRTTINYQQYVSCKTLAQQSTINRKFRSRP